MRVLALGVVLSAVALPCLVQTVAAQTVLKSEPLVLAPYEVAFVQNSSCPAGQVLKVMGVIRGLHRRKTCVTLTARTWRSSALNSACTQWRSAVRMR